MLLQEGGGKASEIQKRVGVKRAMHAEKKGRANSSVFPWLEEETKATYKSCLASGRDRQSDTVRHTHTPYIIKI